MRHHSHNSAAGLSSRVVATSVGTSTSVDSAANLCITRGISGCCGRMQLPCRSRRGPNVLSMPMLSHVKHVRTRCSLRKCLEPLGIDSLCRRALTRPIPP
jgi:hypothetical protein